MEKIEYVEPYTTKDRYEIYTLLACDCEVEGYSLRGSVVWMRFVDSKHCKKILNQLFSKKLKVEAHKMIYAIRDAQILFKKQRMN